jgi:outer membrane protein assembly factor BamD (BamD/ComL family)
MFRGGMKNWLAIFVIAFDKKAREKYEIAQFEELQKNYVHAKKLYQEIIEKYQDSPYAEKSFERLKALETQD